MWRLLVVANCLQTEMSVSRSSNTVQCEYFSVQSYEDAIAPDNDEPDYRLWMSDLSCCSTLWFVLRYCNYQVDSH